MPQASLNYYQSVNVAKVKTDLAPFTSIQAAIDAVTDNTSNKRYLVRVHPGTYTEKVIMEDYIDLVAVGGREETIISFTATVHDEPTLTAENALIKGFTIVSDGSTGTFRTRAVSAATAGFEMEDCILTITNSVGGTDVCLNASASCDIRDCVVDSTGASVTGALFTTGAATYNVARCTFDGATDAIQETTTPTLNLEDCTVSDNFNQDGGTANIRRCRIEAVALGTAACTVTAEMTTFSAAFATADAFAHAITCTKCSFAGQNFTNAATGATTINLRGCDGISTLTNAGIGGTLNLYECGVETLTTTQGTIVAYGGRINACGGSTGTSFVWWQYADELKVISNMKIAHALTAAAAGDVIRVMPGTYAESNLTLKASVNLVGTDSTQCIIAVSDAGNAILNAAVSCTIHNLTVSNLNAGAPAIAVTANSLIVQNCIINGTAAGDAITMVAGTLSVYGTTIGAGDIDLSTAICTLTMYRCQITIDPIDTAGAFAHVMTFEQCDFGTQNLVSAATGACTLAMRGCTNVGTVSNASTGGAFTIRDSDVGTVTASSTGTFVILGGNLNACGGATASITWKTAAQQYEVIAGMNIQHAITNAAADTPAPAVTAPYTVLVHPGIYTGALTVQAYVNITGIGPASSVVVQRETGVIINLNASCDLRNFTVRSVTPIGGFPLIINETSVITSRISELIIEITTPGAWNLSLFSIRQASTITIERCYANIAGTGITIFLGTQNNVANITCIDNDITFSSAAGHHFTATINSTIYVCGGRYAGAAGLCEIGGVASYTFVGCDLSATGTWLITTEAYFYFRNCYIGGVVTSANQCVIYLENCVYQAISRTGTGEIMDISGVAKDLLYHVVKMPLETLDNLATRTAIGGAVTLGGSGQLRVRINDNAADAAGIENNVDAAGALDSSFTSGRGVRYVRQVSVGAFRATTTMFFGLRATVGAAVPTPAEDHFGFIWDGTNFKASSSNGAGVGVTTALVTPSTGAQHQLEARMVRGGVTGGVTFYVDGVLVATHSTGAGIPTIGQVMDFQDYEISTGAGGATTSDVTIRNGFCQECPA